MSPEDIQKTEDKFAQSKTVHGILANVSCFPFPVLISVICSFVFLLSFYQVAETHHLVLEDLYKSVGWPLYKKYGHAYAAFKNAITYVLSLIIFNIFSALLSVIPLIIPFLLL